MKVLRLIAPTPAGSIAHKAIFVVNAAVIADIPLRFRLVRDPLRFELNGNC
jgi:hypothetical protein